MIQIVIFDLAAGRALAACRVSTWNHSREKIYAKFFVLSWLLAFMVGNVKLGSNWR